MVTLLWGQGLLPASLHGTATRNLQPRRDCCEDWPAASVLHGTAAWRLKPWCHAEGPRPAASVLQGNAVRADSLPVRLHGPAIQSLHQCASGLSSRHFVRMTLLHFNQSHGVQLLQGSSVPGPCSPESLLDI